MSHFGYAIAVELDWEGWRTVLLPVGGGLVTLGLGIGGRWLQAHFKLKSERQKLEHQAKLERDRADREDTGRFFAARAAAEPKILEETFHRINELEMLNTQLVNEVRALERKNARLEVLVRVRRQGGGRTIPQTEYKDRDTDADADYDDDEDES